MTQSLDLLSLRAVSKSYGPVPVLHEIDLAIRDGEFLTVLGPSGSGKTTVLRLIGGLESVTSGAIYLDDRDISRVAINRRPFNTVFQDYALFPHMTVAANIGYGLSIRRRPRPEIKRRVTEALDLVQLGKFADRYPAQLSGGQRQRVALARALICEPRLVLLDEPLAALDLELRRQMQEFLKSIQREIKTTFLFVTHDQEEAIGMADRICVMESGRIRQLGTPHELYYRPSCEFVARFLHEDASALRQLSKKQLACQRLFDFLVDQPGHRPGSVPCIKTVFCEPFPGLFGQFYKHAFFGKLAV